MIYQINFLCFSRSHSIFSITVHIKEAALGDEIIEQHISPGSDEGIGK